MHIAAATGGSGFPEQQAVGLEASAHCGLLAKRLVLPKTVFV